MMFSSRQLLTDYAGGQVWRNHTTVSQCRIPEVDQRSKQSKAKSWIDRHPDEVVEVVLEY